MHVFGFFRQEHYSSTKGLCCTELEVLEQIELFIITNSITDFELSDDNSGRHTKDRKMRTMSKWSDAKEYRGFHLRPQAHAVKLLPMYDVGNPTHRLTQNTMPTSTSRVRINEN
jgi:hypothetical protein